MHELVFRKDQNGQLMMDAEGKPLARMLYRLRNGQGLPWHTYGKGSEDPITLQDIHETLGTESEVVAESLYYQDGSLCGLGNVTRWEGETLGLVGPNYRVIQNKTFVDSFKPWLDSGEGEIETFGLLRGGALIWGQVRFSGIEDAEVRPGDVVRPYAMITHAHDGTMGILGGPCIERVVCRNTHRVALSEGGFVKFKHTGNVELKLCSVQEALLKVRKDTDKFLSHARSLASVTVKGTDQIRRFVRIMQGKNPEFTANDNMSRVEQEIERRFRNGIGNMGLDYWDLLNAWTERSTHEEGNDRETDGLGDKEARRLDALWFGTLATGNHKAMTVALEEARKAA